MYLSPQNISKLLEGDLLYNYLHKDQDVCFRITEPDLEKNIPKITEPMLGKITSI